ncbi:hypothetical protein BDV25DRAFT_122966 [Aspergillus avenaceus]|uniref:Uncharacterized protein n=1 Tax=Aspergillus avenaceus TaxID=36643 RepID=A0A5N6TTV9_ASPAV|nr:hypothetical protein BDV25DRAFT_122966 [Aspergillus avenaceus]
MGPMDTQTMGLEKASRFLPHFPSFCLLFAGQHQLFFLFQSFLFSLCALSPMRQAACGSLGLTRQKPEASSTFGSTGGRGIFFLSRDSHDLLPYSFFQCPLHSINRTPFLNPRHEVAACPS